MTSRIYLILIFCLSVFALPGFAQTTEKREPDAKDMDALRRWLQDKRLVTMREIGGDLSISGEVRTEFQATSEKRNGEQLRGKFGIRPMYSWDVDFNLVLDYRAERTWAAAKLRYDNDMGQRSGTVNKISLERAYLGGRLVPGDTFTMDAEIGRRYLGNVFESKLEFAAIFDGLLFRFSKAYPTVGDLIVNLGAFLINDRTDHYGFVAEIGALRIANVGWNIKYSLIDWARPGGETLFGNTAIKNEILDLRYRYLVSQLLSSYQFNPVCLGKKLVKFYGAVLTNHIALADPLARLGVVGQPMGRQNWGWYAGVSIGTVKKMYDWSVETNFQWLQAQAVPSFDVSGIGRGNVANMGLYSTFDDGTGDPATLATATGKGNYYGYAIKALYAFTDNLTINPDWQMSWTLDHEIGPNLIYHQFELEFIYAF